MSRPRLSAREVTFAFLSISLGAWNFYKTQQVAGPPLEPIMNNCLAGEETHSYEPLTGLGIFRPLVCLLTHFERDLVQHYPAGMLVWFGTICVVQPVSVMMTVEAGRKDVRGPVLYPTLISVLSQVFGISVIIPLLWLNGFFLGGRSESAVSETRARVACLLGVVFLGLSFLVHCWLDIESYPWQACAGILGGPIAALVPLLFYTIKPPVDAEESATIEKGVVATRQAYRLAFSIALGIWAFMVHTAWSFYFGYSRGGDKIEAFMSLWNDVWQESHYAVAFMFLDCVVLTVSVLLFIGFYNTSSAVAALLLIPLLGPGAACCLVLEEIETERFYAKSRGLQAEV